MINKYYKEKIDDSTIRIVSIIFALFSGVSIVQSVLKYYSIKLNYDSPLIPNEFIEKHIYLWWVESLLYFIPFGLSLINMKKKYKFLLLLILIMILVIEILEYLLVRNGLLFA